MSRDEKEGDKISECAIYTNGVSQRISLEIVEEVVEGVDAHVDFEVIIEGTVEPEGPVPLEVVVESSSVEESEGANDEEEELLAFRPDPQRLLRLQEIGANPKRRSLPLEWSSDVAKERRVYCKFYENCLDYAVQENWISWSCRECGIRESLSSEEMREQAFEIYKFLRDYGLIDAFG